MARSIRAFSSPGLFDLYDDVVFLAQPVLPEVEQGVVEQLHAVLAAGLDRRVDAVRLVFADQVGDGRRDDQHLVGGDQPLRLSRQQRLARMPMIATESCVRICSCWFVGNTSMMRLTVPCAPVVCSVPNTTWPVSAAVIAGRDRLQVAHFADEDDVRVHPQGAAQRLGEVGHVDADLALIDRATSCACGSTRSGLRS